MQSNQELRKMHIFLIYPWFLTASWKITTRKSTLLLLRNQLEWDAMEGQWITLSSRFSHIGLFLGMDCPSESFPGENCPRLSPNKNCPDVVHSPSNNMFNVPKLHLTLRRRYRGGFSAVTFFSTPTFFRRSQSYFKIWSAYFNCQMPETPFKCIHKFHFFPLDHPLPLSRFRTIGARRCEICPYGE